MANDQNYATRQLQVVRELRVFQPFEGSNAAKLMQRLLTGKDERGTKVDFTRLPMTAKQLAQTRLGRLEGANEADQNYLRGVYVTTSTAVLPNPRGDDVKLDRDCPLVYRFTPKTELDPRNLAITQDQYELNTGFKLTVKQANELRSNSYVLPKVRRAFWEDQFEGDVQLTRDYIADVEQTTGLKFDENAMGLWLPRSKGMRLLGVDRVDDDYWSGASGGSGLDSDGRLVGYVAEPQLVAQKMGVSLDSLV